MRLFLDTNIFPEFIDRRAQSSRGEASGYTQAPVPVTNVITKKKI